jgi:hypothetical protein
MTYGTENNLLPELKLSGASMNAAASSATVNRTHRVVRERAKTIREQRSRVRSLWIPLAVSFGMLALILCALWNVMDESEMFVNGVPDSSQQMLMLSMWCLPLSVVVLAVVWFRRTKTMNGGR